MDKEIKSFLLKYVDSIDEDIYLNFVKTFAKFPARLIKTGEMAVYLKCKLLTKTNKKKNRLFVI